MVRVGVQESTMRSLEEQLRVRHGNHPAGTHTPG